MFSILLVLLIIVAVFMIGIILLQKSEGSGMSGSSAAAMFGGALTGAAAGNFLTKFFRVFWMLQYIELFHVHRAMQAAGQKEMTMQNRLCFL